MIKLRLSCLFSLLVCLFARLPGAAAQTGTGALHGTVLDPTGAAVPGAIVSLSREEQVRSTKSGSAGTYSFRNLVPGHYSLSVTANGFAPLSMPDVAVTAGVPRQLDLPLTIAVQRQQVTVEGQNRSIALSPDQNANATILEGSALDALSDDPSQLSTELQALAGPAAGPNGGQIYIDGFEGGQIPPKSSILAIRVNQNPFSAEYDRIGYGRIEIITKPGTQKLHGHISSYGNTSALNTANPLIATQPSYYYYGFFGDASGPLSKTATWFFHATRFDRQDQAIIDAVNPQDPSQSLKETYPTPFTYLSIGPRVDFALGKNNMFTVRESFYRFTSNGSGVGTLNLPQQASNGVTTFNELQTGETAIVNDHFVNESHFVWDRTSSSQTPVSLAPSITVEGAFTTGGSGSGISREHQDVFEFQNLSTAAAGNHAMHFGVRLRLHHDSSYSTAGANGSYFFKSIAAYQACYPQPSPNCVPSQYSATIVLNPLARAAIFDGALFFQDDWRLAPGFELGLGLRFEGQNRIHDHTDWAPRVSLAWSPDYKSGKQAKTVIRAGYGWFYNRFIGPTTFDGGSGTPYIMQAIHDNGINQHSYVVTNPSFYDPSAHEPASQLEGLSSTIPSYRTVEPDFRAALDMQGGIGVDHQLAKRITANVTYLYTRGIHQYFTNNVTAPVFDTATYSIIGSAPSVYNYQFQSGGIYKQQQVIATISGSTKKLVVNGSYTLNFANSDTQGVTYSPSVPQDPAFDYGRAMFGNRHEFTLLDSYTGPYGIVLASLLLARSGTPYNLTTGSDLTGNNQFNARPTYGVCGAPDVVSTQYGCLDTNPAGKGENVVPFNLGTGPATDILFLRVSKVIGVGPKIEKAGKGQTYHGDNRSVSGRGLSSGGAAIRLDAAAPRKYNLTLVAGVNNVFNVVNYAPPNGVLLSPLFNRSQSLQYGGDGPGNRKINFQVEFSF
jgi:hypothetical protein